MLHEAPQLVPRLADEVAVAGGEDRNVLGEQALEAATLYYLGTRRERLRLRMGAGARLALIGGEPFAETVLMWWNFVARTPEEIAGARSDWEAGRRFGAVPGYRGAVTPAPPLGGRLARPS